MNITVFLSIMNITMFLSIMNITVFFQWLTIYHHINWTCSSSFKWLGQFTTCMSSGGRTASGAVFLSQFTAMARRTLLVRAHRASQSPVGWRFSAALLRHAAGGGRWVWQPVEDPSSVEQLRGIRHVIIRPTHHGKDVSTGCPWMS